MKVNASSSERELVPEGAYGARIQGFTDIGSRLGRFGPYRQFVATLLLYSRKKTGAVVAAKGAAGEQFQISCFVPYQPGKRFREFIAAAMGKEVEGEFDTAELVEQPLKVIVTHLDRKDGGKTAVVDKYRPLTAEERKTFPTTGDESTWFYDIDPAKPIPSDVPEWLQGQIRRSQEWVAVHGEPAAAPAGPSRGGSLSARSTPPKGDAYEGEEDDDEIPY